MPHTKKPKKFFNTAKSLDLNYIVYPPSEGSNYVRVMVDIESLYYSKAAGKLLRQCSHSPSGKIRLAIVVPATAYKCLIGWRYFTLMQTGLFLTSSYHAKKLKGASHLRFTVPASKDCNTFNFIEPLHLL